VLKHFIGCSGDAIDIDSAQSHAVVQRCFLKAGAPFFGTAFYKAESIESICSSATQYF
jgi:hypothetical protein